MPELILGSSSPYRRALLERLRLPFTCEAPRVDEKVTKAAGGSPRAIVQALAREKALAVAGRHDGAVVIGSDQAASVDGQLLDKPGTEDNAASQLRRLRGREHQLLTAVAICHGQGLIEFVDVTRLTVRALTDDEIERYVAADSPLDCAGSYRIEALGISLFARVDSRDQTAIMGLPMIQLCEELRGLGFAVP